MMNYYLAAFVVFTTFAFNDVRVNSAINEQHSPLMKDINHYELMHLYEMKTLPIDLADDVFSKVISFKAFGTNFTLYLKPNHFLSDSFEYHEYVDDKKLIHQNDHPSLSELKSCHFKGKVMVDTNDGGTEQMAVLLDDSSLSVSVCKGRGLRGQFSIINNANDNNSPSETYYIRPAKHLLNRKFDSEFDHHISDEHMIYRHSDMNHDEMQNFCGTPHNHDSDYTSNHVHDLFDINLSTRQRRRRMANSFEHSIEMVAVIAPSLTEYYKSSYHEKRYQKELFAWVFDVISTAASFYEGTNFGNGIGDVTLVLSVVTIWTDWENTLIEEYKPSNLNDIGNTLDEFSDWFLASGHEKYDNGVYFTDKYFGSTVGLAWVGTLCTTRSNNVVRRMSTAENTAVVFAHELGHNLNMNHDGSGDNSGCGGGYIMSSIADWSATGFSSCSVANMNTMYNTNSNYYFGCATNKITDNPYAPKCGNGVIEDGEECDCGCKDCKGIDNCCDGKTCKAKSNSCLICEHQECISIEDLPKLHGVDVNGEFRWSGCFEDDSTGVGAYYINKVNGVEYYLYRIRFMVIEVGDESFSYNGWSGYDRWVIGHRQFQDKFDRVTEAFCDSATGTDGIVTCQWTVISDYNVRTSATTVNVEICDVVPICGLTTNELCSEHSLFEKIICVEDVNSTLTRVNLDQKFKYDDCNDVYPYFKGTGLYLHFDADEERWEITERISSNIARAYCENLDFFQCTGSWYVETVVEGDEVVYVLDKGMDATVCGTVGDEAVMHRIYGIGFFVAVVLLVSGQF